MEDIAETILKYLVSCCLWHLSSALSTICLFLLNTSCFGTEHMEAYTYRNARAQDKAMTYHPPLTNKEFQQIQGKLHQYKDTADENAI